VVEFGSVVAVFVVFFVAVDVAVTVVLIPRHGHMYIEKGLNRSDCFQLGQRQPGGPGRGLDWTGLDVR
jgi:hypothetical protein